MIADGAILGDRNPRDVKRIDRDGKSSLGEKELPEEWTMREQSKRKDRSRKKTLKVESNDERQKPPVCIQKKIWEQHDEALYLCSLYHLPYQRGPASNSGVII